MDLIDRDKLIKDVNDDEEMLKWYNIPLVEAIINAQPTVNEWIPVSKPPKEYGEYWIKTKHRYGVAEYLMCPKKWVDDDGDVYGVIAWKPIEPYTGDKE